MNYGPTSTIGKFYKRNPLSIVNSNLFSNKNNVSNFFFKTKMIYKGLAKQGREVTTSGLIHFGFDYVAIHFPVSMQQLHFVVI